MLVLINNIINKLYNHKNNCVVNLLHSRIRIFNPKEIPFKFDFPFEKFLSASNCFLINSTQGSKKKSTIKKHD